MRKRGDFSIHYDHLQDCLVLFDGEKKIRHLTTFNLLVKILWNIEIKEIEYDEP